MTAAELLDFVRDKLFHKNIVATSLWRNDEIYAALYDAEDAACRRAHLLVDRTTANDTESSPKPLCTLAIVAGTGSYTMSKKIIQVKRIKLALQPLPLTQTSRDEMDGLYNDWETKTGTPEQYISETGTEILITPIPVVNDTATLVVSRLPLGTSGFPEIDPRYHQDLVPYALARLYEKGDPETFNPKLSQYYDNQFDAIFGPPLNALAEQMRRSAPRMGRMMPRAFGS